MTLPLRNTRERYGRVAITLHWLGAATVLAQLVTGLLMFLAPNHDAYLPYVFFHGALGTLMWAVLAARVAWHIAQPRPDKLDGNRALKRLASAVHGLLLVLLILLLVSGPVDIWTSGHAIWVFGLFEVPSPLGDLWKGHHDAIGDFHSWVGLMVGVLVALHLAGVAKHSFIDRDGTLQRMLGLAPRPHRL